MTVTPQFASALGPAIAAFIALQRSLGRKFDDAAATLARLDRFLAAAGTASLTAEAFAAWALTLAHLQPSVRRKHMQLVRRLTLYLRRTDPDCFVPDPQQFPRRTPAKPPFILSQQHILALLRTARGLANRPSSPLRAAVYRLAVVLLYTAGLRRGELLRLRLDDCDCSQRTLLVRAAKYGKSRLVALSADAARELQSYLQQRRRFSHAADSPLLAHGTAMQRAYSGCGFWEGFRTLCQAAGVSTPQGRPPRVHDLRHTYAVHVLLRCYQDGGDPQALLPVLATAMGHASVASTHYYLAHIDPIVAAAAERAAERAAPILGPADGGRRA